jgi:molybdopterin-guanine dinucleotide biosynthesis protein A
MLKEMSVSESSRSANSNSEVAPEPDDDRTAFTEATAIVLAGGLSSRMERDKALLRIDGVTLIERVVARLKPVFKETIISARNRDDYAFLGLRVVPDCVPGQGPLMAIASSLTVSSNDLNFVVSCDIPSLPIDLVAALLRAARNGDGAVAVRSDGRYEPLFAVYRKSMGLAAEEALRRGGRKVTAMYQDRVIQPVRIKNGTTLKNINTMADYHDYCSARALGDR